MNLSWLLCFLVSSVANSVQDCRIKGMNTNGKEQINYILNQYDDHVDDQAFLLWNSKPTHYTCEGFVSCLILCDTWEDFQNSFQYLDTDYDYTSLQIYFSRNGLRNFTSSSRLRVNELFLDEIGLQELSPNVFSVLTATKNVYLSNNRIRIIKTGVFNSLTDLVTLDLSFNDLHFIDSTAFADNKNLSFLYLNYNKFIQISQLIFSHKTSLSVLDFAYNNLSSFDLSLFQAVSQIKAVNISHNNLSDESLMIFSRYHRIEKLIMNHNHFKILKKDIFLELTELREVDLSHNGIQSIDRDLFGNSVKLKIVDFSKNAITFIEDEFFEKLTELEELYLNDNQLSILPNLSQQKYLKFMDILNNPFRNISLDECNFSKIDELFLQSFNFNFSGIQFSLVSPNAKTILLSGNVIDKIDSRMFSNLRNLKHLDVSQNIIESISSDAFRGTINLENLQLQGNHLKSISSHLFNSMHSMLYLNMSYNNFVGFLPGTFDFLDNLTLLDLSFNNIKKITQYNLHMMVNLKTLYLKNNYLVSLGGTEYAKSLKYVSLDNNDWNCDYLSELTQYLRQRNIATDESNASFVSQSNINGIKCFQAGDIPTTEKMKYIESTKSTENLVNTSTEYHLISDHEEYIPLHSLNTIADENEIFIVEFKTLMYISCFALIGILCTTCFIVYIMLYENKNKFVNQIESQ